MSSNCLKSKNQEEKRALEWCGRLREDTKQVIFQWADQLSYHRAQTQGSEVAHPTIYPIYGLLELMKGPVPQIQSFI